MRGVILAFLCGVALAAVSAHATPLAPTPATIKLGTEPSIELVDRGCGWGWHRVHWQDHQGYWHWHCVPYGHVHHGRTKLEHPYDAWQGPSGGWGNP
jgi:hypothetical protein